MKARWNQLRTRFMALPRRERMLLPGAVCFAILMLGHLLLIEPASKQLAQLRQGHAQNGNDLQVAQTQVTLLRAKLSNPDAELKAQLEALRTQTRSADAQFKQLQGSLVPAQEMTQWLSSLLQAQRGLQLVGLRSLPPTSVGELANARKAGPAAAPVTAEGTTTSISTLNPAIAPLAAFAAASAAAGGPPLAAAPASAPGGSAPDAWLYRHGVEVTVRGSYQELLAYLKALEQMPRRVYWGELRLDATSSPAVVMTLTVYTLSVDKAWWVI